MSANQFVEESLVRHQIYLLRYSGTASRLIKKELNRLSKEVNRILLSEGITENQLAKYTIMRVQIEELTRNLNTYKTVLESSSELAKYETEFIEKLYSGSVTVDLAGLSVDRVIASVTSKPMSILEGKDFKKRTIEQLVEIFDNNVSNQIMSTISTGILEGKSIDTIARDVTRMSKTRLYNDSEALVRTVNLHVGNVSRQMFYEQNSEVISKEQYVATLDSRTTLTCARYDGMMFAINQGPQPPLHYNAIPKGEMVKTVQGDKPIEEIKAGDYVLTHRGRFKKVLATMSKANESGFIREIKSISSRVARMTDDHPTLVSKKGWIRADRVKVGDELHEYDSSASHVVSSSVFVPQDYPSIFDGNEVFSEVDVVTASVPSPVNLKNKLNVWYSEISYRVVKNKLLRKINSKTCEYISKLNFSFRKVCKKLFPKRFESFYSRLFVVGWIVSFHSNRGIHASLTSFFSGSVCPVIFSTINSICYVFSGYNLCYAAFANCFNFMFYAPPTNHPVRKTKLSFNLTKRFFKSKVVMLDKIGKIFSVFKIHNFSPFKVSSINTVSYTGKVYNLEVEEDNSFLVNGVIVHNCRSVRVGIINKGFGIDTETGSRPQVGSDGIKTTSTQTTFNSFFKRQSEEWQKDYLGKTRYNMYKKGKLNIQAFTDDTGRVLTIDELRLKEGLTLGQ